MSEENLQEKEKKKRGRYVAHKTKSVPSQPPDKKKSPKSIRDTLNNIRETAKNGDKETNAAYAEILNKNWKGPRYGEKKIGLEIFRSTEKGKNKLYYWQLEAYARELGVPTALILTFSRVLSEGAQDGDWKRACAVLRGMRAAIDECEQQVDARNLKIRPVIAAYKKAGGPPMKG